MKFTKKKITGSPLRPTLVWVLIGSIFLMIMIGSWLVSQKTFLPSKVSEPKLSDTIPTPKIYPSSVPADPALTRFIENKFLITNKGNVDIGGIEGNYAFGSAITDKLNGGGFWWGAEKINGSWSRAFDGNGVPDCIDVKTFPVGTFKGYFDRCVDTNNRLFDRTTGKEVSP